jgi:uncharacterized protein (DUF697 family)
MTAGKKEPDLREGAKRIAAVLMDVVATIPESMEVEALDPKTRSALIVGNASLRAAAVSGGLALPPGPLGMLTIVPDLVVIWRIQAQMVADIAAIYGKTAVLTKEQMIYCLFRHAASQVVRDLVVRVGQRILIRRVSLRIIQSVLSRIGVRVLQRSVAKSISRWLPLIGPIGVGAYAYWDTSKVGETALDLFSREITVE